jgi:hypothetical protein
VAEVLTMCCFFGAAWVHPCCIGMTGVGSYKKRKNLFFFLDWLRVVAMSFKYALFFDDLVTKLSELLMRVTN